MIRFNRSITSIRCLHSSAPACSFLGDWLGWKKQDEQNKRFEKKQKKDLIKEQDDFEEDAASKIVILNKENSSKAEKFSIETHMPDFKIHQWKSKSVSPKQIERTYTSEDLERIISETLESFDKPGSTVQSFSEVKLDDLAFRFKFTKALQKSLGFEISDLVLTKSHDLKILFEELEQLVNRRFKNERNPGDISLRQSDFTAPNVYVNQQLSEAQQAREFKKLLEQARNSL